MNQKIKKNKENQPTILIVDDDLNVLEVLDARLTSTGYLIYKANNGNEAIKLLKKHTIDLMISDMKMPGMNGLDLLDKARDLYPALPVIFLTAYGSIPDAVEAMKAGAVDYLAKPFDGRQLIDKIRETFKKIPAESDEPDQSPVIQDFKRTKSNIMKELYSIVKRVANSNVSVLILGESGVGKERIARLIHELSPRKDKPFIVVDCGSTPAGLLESELFGHVRGAFTHAVSDKKGLIESANQGTLFLDEIGNISSEMQVRLLRFIESRKIRRVGELKEKSVECRIIAATNSDLVDEIKKGNFREDLYYRLRVVTVKVPSLKERKDDIPLLARHFVQMACTQNALPMVKLPDKTLRFLCEYPWHGNVRELKNTIEAGVVLCKDNILKPNDLHLTGLPEMQQETVEPANTFSLEETERMAILRALKKTGGVQKEAAELLGISRRAIHYKIKKYNINSAELRKL